MYKKADFDRARDSLKKIDDRLESGKLTSAQQGILQRDKRKLQNQIKRMEKDLADQKGSIKGRKDAERAEFHSKKKGIEGRAKGKGTVSNILYKYLARQGKKDPKFQKMFGDDPKKLDKVAKQTRNMLRRQLKRRGYDMDSAEIKKIMLEMLIKEDIHLIKDNTKFFAEQLVKELKSRGVI